MQLYKWFITETTLQRLIMMMMLRWLLAAITNHLKSSFIIEKIVGKLLRMQNTRPFQLYLSPARCHCIKVLLTLWLRGGKTFKLSLNMENLTSHCTVFSLLRYCLITTLTSNCIGFSFQSWIDLRTMTQKCGEVEQFITLLPQSLTESWQTWWWKLLFSI
jgi:hypothetical protein